MNAVTCLQWIKRGAAKSVPDKVKLTEDELRGLIKGMKQTDLNETSSDEAEDTRRKRKLPGGKIQQSNLKSADSDEDSDDDGDDDDETNPISMAGIAYYASQGDDPHMSKDLDSDEDEEILPNDNLIAVGKVNKDYCNLEIYVYNEEEGNCWCHHDYILPTIPLCLEWLNFDPSCEKTGNFVAIGSMGSDIEIWDLDVLDTLEPSFVLAGKEKQIGKKKKKKSSKGHTDAILDLSWNRNHTQALASASADFTLGLWDLDEGKMVTHFQHQEKVQCIEWHPSDAQSLLSGSADKNIRLFDCRTLEPDVKSWSLTGEVENVVWNKFNSENFLASTDHGELYCFDKRHSKPLFHSAIHSDSITGISLCDSINGCLVTSSSDKTVKVWDLKQNELKHVLTKELKIGQLFCVSGCPDSSLTYAVGGERELRVINLKKNTVVAEYFGFENMTSVEPGDVEVPVGDGESDREDDEGINIGVKKNENFQQSDLHNTIEGNSESGSLNKKKKKKKKKKK